MQGLAAIAAILAIGFGLERAGPLGALTGLVTVLTIGSGVAVVLGEGGTGVSSTASRMGNVQRIGGWFAATAALVASAHGGWRWGWLWAIGGYCSGIGVALGVGLLTGIRSEPNQ